MLLIRQTARKRFNQIAIFCLHLANDWRVSAKKRQVLANLLKESANFCIQVATLLNQIASICIQVANLLRAVASIWIDAATCWRVLATKRRVLATLLKESTIRLLRHATLWCGDAIALRVDGSV
jgi:hypothetical protein